MNFLIENLIFRQIRRASNDGKYVWINWPENWVSFLDNMLQGVLLMEKGEALKFPVRLRYMRIDPEHHREYIEEVGTDRLIKQHGILNTHGIVAGGVEMKDLDAISTPRRLHPAQNRPTIERMEFVPFFEENCLAPRAPDLYQNCAEYLNFLKGFLTTEGNFFTFIYFLEHFCKLFNYFNAHFCKFEGKSMAAALDVKLSEISASATDSESVQKFSQNPLFTCLKQLCELDWKNAPASALQSAKSFGESTNIFATLFEDPLWALPLHQALIKPLVDFSMQNTAGHRGRLGIWQPSSVKAGKNLKKMFESNPMVTVDVTFLGPDVDRLNDEAKKGLMHTKVLQIDDHVNEKHNIFYIDSLRFEESPMDTLRKFKEFYVTPAAFILLCEIVEKPGQIVAECLEKTQFSVAPKYHTDSEWRAIFGRAGLHLVASRTDGLMFATYLLRPPQPETISPTIVFCDDTKDFSWLGELQKQLETHKSEPDPRVWAITESTTENGLRALARCIKEEDAHRIQIRSIANTGTTPVKFDLNSAEIRAIFARDLCCNEFRDGRWGSSVFFSIPEEELVAKIPCENAHITVQNRGDLSTLRWVESANKFWKHEVRILFPNFKEFRCF